MAGSPSDPVRLSPFQRIVKLTANDTIEYLIATARFFTNSSNDLFQGSENLGSGEGYPYPPDDYAGSYITSRTVSLDYTNQLYGGNVALYDADGEFIGNGSGATASGPAIPSTLTYSGEVISLLTPLKADLGGPVSAPFPTYKSAIDPVGYYSGTTATGVTGNYRGDIGGIPYLFTFYQFVDADKAASVNLLPVSVSWNGMTFTPIGARATGPFSDSFGFTDLILSVLCRKS